MISRLRGRVEHAVLACGPVLACGLGLVALLAWELRTVPEPRIVTIMAGDAPVLRFRTPAVHAAPDRAGLAAMILARPLFSPGRRTQPPATTGTALPRLTGLVLAPGYQLALLQADDGSGRRPMTARLGHGIDGWIVTRIDTGGVILSRDGSRVHLALRQADIRPGMQVLLQTPIEKIVLMPEKRTNPQLAW